MKVVSIPLIGIIIFETKRFEDDRGFFLESYEAERYRALGVTENFVQDNHSRSRKNVLRGLHFTRHNPQAQLLTVMNGTVFDVVVDIRKDSRTFGKWFGTELSAENTNQIYMAPGFAHGFYVLSECADLHYKVSQFFNPKDDFGLIWNDYEVGVQWPSKSPLISVKDSNYPLLSKITPL